ncbi:MAG: LysM domain-containing protein [Pseudomonadota bacterium]|nr:LysM domain-containing protein [Pseudomonadota bacterium]
MPQKYTVKKGDTLWDIAKQHNVSFQELKKTNPNIMNRYPKGDKHYGWVFVGDEVNIPNQELKNKKVGETCEHCQSNTPPPAWLEDALEIMCPQDKAFLDDLRKRGVTITAYDRIYYEDPYYDGTKWTTKTFEGGGSTVNSNINIVIQYRDDEAIVHKIPPESIAETVYHEGIHTAQPDSMPWLEKEYDAYTRTEQWAIEHGLPTTRPGFRTQDASGTLQPDTTAIKAFVDNEYPITMDEPTTPGGSIYTVVDKTSDGQTIVQNVTDPADVKIRPPQKGDTFAGPQLEEPPGGRPVKPEHLKCP